VSLKKSYSQKHLLQSNKTIKGREVCKELDGLDDGMQNVREMWLKNSHKNKKTRRVSDKRILSIKELGETMTHEKFKECCKGKIKMVRKSISTVSSRP